MLVLVFVFMLVLMLAMMVLMRALLSEEGLTFTSSKASDESVHL